MRWPWWPQRPTEEVRELDERLRKIDEDDKRVDQLGRRVHEIMREDSLAPAVRRALRMQP